MNNYIRPLPDLGTDRMCVIEIHLPRQVSLYIIGVYLPYQGCTLAKFQDEITILEELLIQFHATSKVLIIGDTNSHMGLTYSRSWGSNSYNGNLFENLICRNNMVITDLLNDASGPNYTFQRNGKYSYIDHSAITFDTLGLVRKTEILSDTVMNVSDHLPIKISLDIPTVENNQIVHNKKIAWSKMSREEIKNKYQIPLDNKVKDLFEDFGINSNEILAGKLICNNELDLNRFIQCFTEQIRAIGDTLPTSKFNKSVKPYWDDILNQLKNDKKETRQSWVSLGKPREADNPNYEAYKEAKRNFRKALRRKKFEYDLSLQKKAGF